MKTKEITICSKQVTLAYCFATEISYKILAEEDITDFIESAINDIQNKHMPDMRKSIYAILAAMSAYCEANGVKENPITDDNIMFNATPTEIGTAIGTIIGLRTEFYRIPKDEQEEEADNKTDENKKNA